VSRRRVSSRCSVREFTSILITFSLEALLLTVSALQAIGADRYRILLTIVPPRPIPEGDNARSAILEAKLPIFRGEIRRLIAFQRAALTG
jgi:chromosome partitioning protein